MARIVCHVRYRPERITFVWSDGQASFKPYSLTGSALETFQRCAAQTRERLVQGDNGFALAQAGHELYQALFADQGGIRDWLAGQNASALEIVSDAPGATPWNALYDQQPDAGAFTGNHPDAFRPFWGVRYALATGGRANVWRQLPVLDSPRVVAIIDPRLRDVLSEAEQRRLQDFVEDKHIESITTRSRLLEGMSEAADVVYVLAPANAAGFTLDGEAVTADELREALTKSPGNAEPLVILNLVAGKDSGSTDPLAAFANLHGVIGAVAPVNAVQASTFGLQLLQDVLSSGQNVAGVLQKLRGQTPFPGLLYAARCPGEVRVLLPDASGDIPQPPAQPLPERPYRPLAPYDREQQALLSGRDQDLAGFCNLLDRAGTRLLVLHGGSSVGKTSFLQAAVVPFLEQSTFGFMTLADRTDADSGARRVVIRSGGDLLAQVAAALSTFCARPYSYQTPTGETVQIDLPGILARTASAQASTQVQTVAPPLPEGAAAAPDPEKPEDSEFAVVLRRDPAALEKLLGEISAHLPFELLIVVDDVEDLYTQAETDDDRRRRREALRQLQQAAANGHCKVVLSVRSDYAGQLFHELSSSGASEYLLNQLTEQQIADAIVLPTTNEAILFSTELPFSKYGFQFAAGVQDKIAKGALRAAEDKQIGVLPIVQCVCARLATLVTDRPDRIVREEDLKQVGGIDDAVVNYTEMKLKNLPLSKGTQQALRGLFPLLYTRHPDGTVTRDLVPAPELKNHWSDKHPIQNAVEAASSGDDGLFEVSRQLSGGARRLYVSLTQDSLAQAHKQWDQQRQRKAAARSVVYDMLWIGIPLTLLAAALIFFFWRRAGIASADLAELNKHTQELTKNQKELQKKFTLQAVPFYAGTLAGVEQAWQLGNLGRVERLLANAAPELRAFEWYYLWNLTHPSRYFAQEDKSLLTRAALTPDGKLVAVCELGLAADGRIVETGVQLRDVSSEAEPVKLPAAATVAFADKGKTLITAGSGGVSFWDVEQLLKESKATPPRMSLKADAAVRSIAVDDERGVLATGCADNKIILWDLAKGERRKELKEHGSEIKALAFAADGALASADSDGTICIWKTDGEKLHTIKSKDAKVHALAFSPDGKQLAAGGGLRDVDTDIGSVRVWQTASASPVGKPIQQGVVIKAIVYTPDGKSVAAGGDDPFIRFWEPESGREVSKLPGQLGGVLSAALSKDGSTFALTDHTGLRVWQTSSDAPFPFAKPAQFIVQQAHTGAVNGVVPTKDGRNIISASADGAVKIWHKDGRLQSTLAELKSAVTAIALSKDQVFAVGTASGDKGEIRLWQLETSGDKVAAKDLGAIKEMEQAIYSLAFSADGKTLAASGLDKKIHLWKWPSQEKLRTLEGNPALVRALAFHDSGDYLASGGDDGILRIWIIEEGKALRLPPLHREAITAVLFYLMPHEAGPVPRVLTASMDGMILEWPLDQKSAPFAYRGHAGGVSALAVSPDNRVILSASWDQTIKAFDTAAVGGPERFTFIGHNAPVQCLALGGDPPMLVSGDRDGRLRFWRTVSPKEVAAPDSDSK